MQNSKTPKNYLKSVIKGLLNNTNTDLHYELNKLVQWVREKTQPDSWKSLWKCLNTEVDRNAFMGRFRAFLRSNVPVLYFQKQNKGVPEKAIWFNTQEGRDYLWNSCLKSYRKASKNLSYFF